ncbi:MAG: hypothetical protein A3C93_05740 [Candidatus Lloydbacteria bacterium RIFCSPHIGHO2_02_FULL_54_17]|uniref:Uncharacterized protein n=1 Tax=Candidatus Lloydbacteria bacterium RIFCSPHIGHO2_02_FULL_54_17 TaxID=1798664 RepID=A0A1G2DAZ3_9BACT|nr:MAG: hypothetical protein A2762_03210 [Candidatus Lloydbacteria bacterium RIFCSPHIGHO2_01_FULL_54_11]OGZ10786.1 MAG: hypothetical protein A3C93_05740 [Candidatus Lloydbacteria bacterium RIFCSPHIGHO2_02_FULL_54_17]OGZ16534.1 MAG: hypothetical protein A3H76_04580 [Candidatus Lloydbacteria bacterium RIFCSPLOWO2_02_FULL_54_12]
MLLALFVGTIVPMVAFATSHTGLVVCNGPDCDFNKLVLQVQKVINFLIISVAAPLSAVMFAYAGFLYVTNRGNESQISQAHEIFWNVFIGLVVALAAWLTVNFILVFFLDAEFIFLTNT